MTLTTLAPRVATFGLVLVRCTGLFLMIPTVGGEVVPVRLRGALAAIIALALGSLVQPRPVWAPVDLVAAAVGELLLGAAMGLVVRLLLSAAEMAGELVGLQIGLGFAQIVDPLSRESSPVTGRLNSLLAVLLFLALDGHRTAVAGLAASLRDAPPGAVLARLSHLEVLVPLLGTACRTAVHMAAPLILALYLVNAGLGLLARAAPQLNLFVLSFGITVSVGLLVLAVSARPSLTVLAGGLQRLAEQMGALVGG